MKQQLKKGDNIKFTIIANSVLYDKNLSLRAKGMWAYLYSKPDDYQFSVNRIPEDTTDGRKTCMAVMKELEQAGYLVRERMTSGKVEYTIYFEPKFPKGTQGLKQPRSPGAQVAPGPGAQREPISNTDSESNTDTESNTEDICPFDTFWSAYPKKELKKKARDIWERKKLDTHVVVILTFIEKAKTTDRWLRGFIKQPTTFLTNESWLDDLAAYGGTTISPKNLLASKEGKYANL